MDQESYERQKKEYLDKKFKALIEEYPPRTARNRYEDKMKSSNYQARYTVVEFVCECAVFAVMLWAFVLALMFL